MKRAWAILFVFSLSFSAASGERLPPGILAHASVKSFISIVSRLDAFAVACTANTGSSTRVIPGEVAATAGMSIAGALPAGAWNQHAEMHAVAVVAEPMNPQPVILLKTPGTAAFKSSMSTVGIELTGDGGNMSGVIPVLGQTWHFADAGYGLMACSPNGAARDFIVQAIASGWVPKHGSGADISVDFDLKNLMAAFGPVYDVTLSELKRALEEELAPADAMKTAVLRVAVKALDAVADEVPALDKFGINLSLDGGRLKAAFSVSADEGSGIDTLRAAYSGAGQPDYALVRPFPEETAFIDAGAGLPEIPPGWIAFYEETLRELGGVVMPAEAERFAGLARRFAGLGIGEVATGSSLVDDRFVFASYFKHGGAQGIENFLAEALELGQDFLNSLARAAGDGEAPRFAIVHQPQAGRIGNVPYHRISFSIASPGEEEPISCDFLFALGKETVACVFGQAEESDLRRVIDNFQRPAGGFIESESIGAVLREMGDRRIRMMVMRPLQALANSVVYQAGLVGGDRQAKREEVSELLASRGCFAMAVGADDSALIAEYVIPAELVNECIRHADLLNRIGKSLSQAGEEQP